MCSGTSNPIKKCRVLGLTWGYWFQNWWWFESLLFSQWLWRIRGSWVPDQLRLYKESTRNIRKQWNSTAPHWQYNFLKGYLSSRREPLPSFAFSEYCTPFTEFIVCLSGPCHSLLKGRVDSFRSSQIPLLALNTARSQKSHGFPMFSKQIREVGYM